MALEDMKSRYSPQPLISFRKDNTAYNSSVQPVKSVVGQQNLTSEVKTIPFVNGSNNLISTVQPIFVGSGLAKENLLKK
tara:strand:+ start:564 stop:800 length:237 start_codon:yes stop_codon:yes gene_type:complete